MKRSPCFALLLALCLCLSACVSGVDIVPAVDRPDGIETLYTPAPINAKTAPSVTPMPIGEQNPESLAPLGDFALELLQQNAEGENVLLSPTSILSALGMTALGAQGETLREMEDAFGVQLPELNRAMSILQQQGKDYGLINAQSLWIRDDLADEVQRDFLDANAAYYDAEVFTAPFGIETSNEVNAWIKKKTNGRIPRLVEEIEDTTAMLLVNALTLDAEWETPYTPEQLTEGQFTTASGEKVAVYYMNATLNSYVDLAHAQGFTKAYKDSPYIFLAILPEEGMTPGDWLQSLAWSDVQEAMTRDANTQVETSIPKFSADFTSDLADALKAMGMELPFSDVADFSGLLEEREVYIDKVLHKAQITVDEKGTEAAAATVVVLWERGVEDYPDLIRVHLNRPFLYFIVDSESQLPVFAGILEIPA